MATNSTCSYKMSEKSVVAAFVSHAAGHDCRFDAVLRQELAHAAWPIAVRAQLHHRPHEVEADGARVESCRLLFPRYGERAPAPSREGVRISLSALAQVVVLPIQAADRDLRPSG